eukprot:3185573-Rhodomonas_salina.1
MYWPRPRLWALTWPASPSALSRADLGRGPGHDGAAGSHLSNSEPASSTQSPPRRRPGRDREQWGTKGESKDGVKKRGRGLVIGGEREGHPILTDPNPQP